VAAAMNPLSEYTSIQALVRDLVDTRASLILRELCRSSRNGTITPQEALSGIATIAGLRALESDLEDRLK
jgi:hypothetical protein